MKFETAVGKIRRGGYKATPQRLAILGAIAAEQHQRMEEIRDRCPGVGLVTVYRTLDLFSELGMVRRVDVGDCTRYETAEHHHHHLRCEGRVSVAGFEPCHLDPARLPQVSSDFEISAHSLDVYG